MSTGALATHTWWSISLAPPLLLGPVVWQRRQRRNTTIRNWVIGGAVALALVLLLLWQYTPLFRGADLSATEATSILRVLLEPTPEGPAISVVLVDRLGRDATVTGDVNVNLREPDGQLWSQTFRVGPDSFQPLPATSLLPGRLGFRTVVPATAWSRPPRQGGQASITVIVTPAGRAPLPLVTQTQVFP